MKKVANLLIRIQPDLKKELKLEAKFADRTLSNYVLFLVNQARKGDRK